MKWYTSKGSMGQGLVIDDADGRNVAVAYDEKDAPLLAAAPELAEALVGILPVFDNDKLTAKQARSLYAVELAAIRAALEKAGVTRG